MRPEICSPNGHAGRKSAVVFLCISFARQRRNSDWKDWFAHRARRFRDATWWDQSRSSNVEAKCSRHPSVESNVLARENYEPCMWRIACSLPLRGKHPFVGILDEMSDRRWITTRGMSKFWVLRYTKDATYARMHIEIVRVRVRIEIRFGVPCQGLKCELKIMSRSIPSGTFSDSFDAPMTRAWMKFTLRHGVHFRTRARWILPLSNETGRVVGHTTLLCFASAYRTEEGEEEAKSVTR